jgi:hypothetical protein
MGVAGRGPGQLARPGVGNVSADDEVDLVGPGRGQGGQPLGP